MYGNPFNPLPLSSTPNPVISLPSSIPPSTDSLPLPGPSLHSREGRNFYANMDNNSDKYRYNYKKPGERVWKIEAKPKQDR